MWEAPTVVPVQMEKFRILCGISGGARAYLRQCMLCSGTTGDVLEAMALLRMYSGDFLGIHLG